MGSKRDREITIATTSTFHNVGEKVTAFNWFELKYPFSHGTYIKKYHPEDTLSEGEECRKIANRDMKVYNIGQFKIKAVLGSIAQIVPWERQDNV